MNTNTKVYKMVKEDGYNHWFIEGLNSDYDGYDAMVVPELYRELNGMDNYIQGLSEDLYDIRQMSSQLKDGDVIESEATQTSVGLIPALRFTVNGVGLDREVLV